MTARSFVGTSPAEPAERDRLAALLARAATGDAEAFMRFYDATSTHAYRLALCRLRDRAAAEDATCALYLEAWIRSGEHACSGHSPLAWLLGLGAGPGSRDARDLTEAAAGSG